MVYPANFTPVVDVLDKVHFNATYTIAPQPWNVTTPEIYIIFGLLGVGLLLLSCKGNVDAINDLAGILATPILLITAITSFAVDTVTGYGVTSQPEVTGTLGSQNIQEFMMMESHTIYHYDIWGVFFSILFIISLANLYRLWLDYTRIINVRPIAHDKPGRYGQPPPKQFDESDNANKEPRHIRDE